MFVFEKKCVRIKQKNTKKVDKSFMEKKEIKNMHNGHRERLTSLVLSAGIDGVSKIQSVEFFLTYIFPRGDVNPLAHRLLDKFGSFSNIIDADIGDLVSVEGINTRSAQKIKLIGQIIDFYTLSKLDKNINLQNTGKFLDLLEALLKVQSTENLLFFAISHNFKLVQKKRFDLKRVREVGLSPLELYGFISASNPAYLIVAHNHPDGSAAPSPDDRTAVQFIQSLLEHLECKLLDSFIVGEDGIYSELQGSFVRTFSDSKIAIVQ